MLDMFNARIVSISLRPFSYVFHLHRHHCSNHYNLTYRDQDSVLMAEIGHNIYQCIHWYLLSLRMGLAERVVLLEIGLLFHYNIITLNSTKNSDNNLHRTENVLNNQIKYLSLFYHVSNITSLIPTLNLVLSSNAKSTLPK